MQDRFPIQPTPEYKPSAIGWEALGTDTLAALAHPRQAYTPQAGRPEAAAGSWDALSTFALRALANQEKPGPADQLLAAKSSTERLRPDIQRWAEQELGRAFAGWKRYTPLLEVPPPDNIHELPDHTPNPYATLTRLYEARMALTNSGICTPEGANVGRTMHLVTIPWGAMGKNLQAFDGWLEQMRQRQGAGDEADFLDPRLLAAIKGDVPFYRDPDTASRRMTALAYLSKKYRQDGPWGIMLTQTTGILGDSELSQKSPDELTNNGAGSLTYDIAGREITMDGLGVFEWLALTFQHNPGGLSQRSRSWLLANRVYMLQSKQSFVPVGARGKNRTATYLAETDSADGIRTRLAVL